MRATIMQTCRICALPWDAAPCANCGGCEPALPVTVQVLPRRRVAVPPRRKPDVPRSSTTVSENGTIVLKDIS